jgi:hypothetical protein
MESAIVPHNYDTWHRCITVDCNIQLTVDFIHTRIIALQDDKDFRTQQFIKLYGEQHRQDVLGWFQHTLQSI